MDERRARILVNKIVSKIELSKEETREYDKLARNHTKAIRRLVAEAKGVDLSIHRVDVK